MKICHTSPTREMKKKPSPPSHFHRQYTMMTVCTEVVTVVRCTYTHIHILTCIYTISSRSQLMAAPIYRGINVSSAICLISIKQDARATGERARAVCICVGASLRRRRRRPRLDYSETRAVAVVQYKRDAECVYIWGRYIPLDERGLLLYFARW